MGRSFLEIAAARKTYSHIWARAFQSVARNRGCADYRQSLLDFTERKSENQNTRVRTQFRLPHHRRRLLCRAQLPEISAKEFCRAGAPACRRRTAATRNGCPTNREIPSRGRSRSR